MAYYNINSFWYDEQTGNVFLYLNKDVETSYEHMPEETAQDIYEAQIYLDGGLNLIGKNRPSSVDGTVQGGLFGRGATPVQNVTHPLEDAPE